MTAAGVRVSGATTRQAFFVRSALAAGATLGAAAGPAIRSALAQEAGSAGPTDFEILDFALGLEYLEADYYEGALRELRGLGGEARRVAEELADNEAEHAATLEQLAAQLGGTPTRRPRFDFGDAYGSQSSFLRLAQTFEDTGVAAYNGAGPLIDDPDILDAAGRIVQVEGRHAAVIRLLRDEPIAPMPFDEGLSMERVEGRVEPFIAGAQ